MSRKIISRKSRDEKEDTTSAIRSSEVAKGGVSSELSVCIAGAGLSGLCLAHGLLRAGIDVQIYERDPSPHARRQGYRITIDEHGTRALKRCLPPHLFNAVVATASREEVGYFRFTNRNLGEIFKLTFNNESASDEIQRIDQVDRATLRTILLSEIEDRVHFGMTADSVETTADEAILHFADGSSASASVVVGADGKHSVLREQLLPDCPLRDTGSRAIYGKTPLVHDGESLIPPTIENSGVWAVGSEPGRGFYFTSMCFNESPDEVFARLVKDQQPPVSEDYVMWAVLLPESDAPERLRALDVEELHRLADTAASEYHPIIRDLVELADIEYTVATELSAATRPKDWAASRTTLMGDAVHVMPPTGAHGGNTALRDAAQLSANLRGAASGSTSIERAIGEYQRNMLDYAFDEVESAIKMLERSKVQNPILRYALLRGVPWARSKFGTSLVQ